MAGALVGRECKLFYNSNTYASPTLVEITKAIDVNASLSKSYGDISSRDSQWRKQKPALKDLTFSFGYRYAALIADSVFDTLHDNAIADTVTEIFVLDAGSATSGCEGFRAEMDLAFDEDQPLEDGVACQFECVLVGYDSSGTSRDPSWYEVA
jgi:hypothetical protein